MKRKIWLDYARALACILVALGHLVMSFEEAGIVANNMGTHFFIDFIYYFHVYVFLFCSGYLFQISFNKIQDTRKGFKQRITKCIDFAIPYVIFTTITHGIKVLLSSDVNSPQEYSLLSTLLKHPVNQMWYLYVMVLIFAIVPVIKTDKSMYILVGICGLAKVVAIMCDIKAIVPIEFLCSYTIWFVLGMVWSYKSIYLKRWETMTLSTVFLITSVFAIWKDIRNPYMTMCLNAMGMIAFVELVHLICLKKEKISRILGVVSKYMFQIYLLHTICAAGIRIVLLKVGNTNLLVHMLAGIVFSFVVPILCAYIAEKSKVLNIVFFPSKTIKSLRKVE